MTTEEKFTVTATRRPLALPEGSLQSVDWQRLKNYMMGFIRNAIQVMESHRREMRLLEKCARRNQEISVLQQHFRSFENSCCNGTDQICRKAKEIRQLLSQHSAQKHSRQRIVQQFNDLQQQYYQLFQKLCGLRMQFMRCFYREGMKVEIR
ncbi:MAG: hypothetical protein AAFO94_21660 [Bacteroidota bacterium]